MQQRSNRKIDHYEPIRGWAGQRWHLLWLLPLLSVMLTGCFDYEVGVRFRSASSGELVQNLQLSERLGSFQDESLRSWADAIAERSRGVGGQVTVQPQALRVRIPFGDAADLETKFNQFFAPAPTTPPPLGDRSPLPLTLPRIPATLTLQRNNALLMERNHLHAELDLRALGVTAANGAVLLSPATGANLAFRLELPWGSQARSLVAANSTIHSQSHTLLWQLTPGTLNQLDLVFWMPNAIGIGALAIGLLVLVGMLLKQRQPANPSPSSQPLRFHDSP
jgi:hypothetical protein